MLTNALVQIEELQKQITKLRAEAIEQLRAKKEQLLKEIAGVDAQIAKLTGVSTEKKQSQPQKELVGKSIPLQELKVLLSVAPDKTLSIRKERLQIANIKTLARVNPHLLRLGGKGAWPTVTLLI